MSFTFRTVQFRGTSRRTLPSAAFQAYEQIQNQNSDCLPHSYPTDPLNTGLGSIAHPSPRAPVCGERVHTGSHPLRLRASLPKFSQWNKSCYRFSVSLLPHPPLLLFCSPSSAVSTSLGLRKLCYHGDAWGCGPIGGFCCDAASRQCGPPDWLPFQCTSLCNTEPESAH